MQKYSEQSTDGTEKFNKIQEENQLLNQEIQQWKYLIETLEDQIKLQIDVINFNQDFPRRYPITQQQKIKVQKIQNYRHEIVEQEKHIQQLVDYNIHLHKERIRLFYNKLDIKQSQFFIYKTSKMIYLLQVKWEFMNRVRSKKQYDFLQLRKLVKVLKENSREKITQGEYLKNLSNMREQQCALYQTNHQKTQNINQQHQLKISQLKNRIAQQQYKLDEAKQLFALQAQTIQAQIKQTIAERKQYQQNRATLAEIKRSTKNIVKYERMIMQLKNKHYLQYTQIQQLNKIQDDLTKIKEEQDKIIRKEHIYIDKLIQDTQQLQNKRQKINRQINLQQLIFLDIEKEQYQRILLKDNLDKLKAIYKAQQRQTTYLEVVNQNLKRNIQIALIVVQKLDKDVKRYLNKYPQQQQLKIKIQMIQYQLNYYKTIYKIKHHI